MNSIALAAGATAGLASALHCAGMCGPVSLLCMQQKGGVIRYLLGRLASYTLLGAIAGSIGAEIGAAMRNPTVAAALSWSLAIALFITGQRLWRGRGATLSSGFVKLGGDQSRSGNLTKRVGKVLAYLAQKPGIIGLLTPALPCGALTSALIIAASFADTRAGAAAMAGFAVSSSLGLALGGALLGPLFKRSIRPVRRTLGVACMVGAVVLAVRPIDAMRLHGGEAAHCHDDTVSWR